MQTNFNVMKRYLVFIGRYYYPSGGMYDFLIDADSIKESIEALENEILKDYEFMKFGYDSKEEYSESKWESNWAHVYDTHLKKIVWKKEN